MDMVFFFCDFLKIINKNMLTIVRNRNIITSEPNERSRRYDQKHRIT